MKLTEPGYPSRTGPGIGNTENAQRVLRSEKAWWRRFSDRGSTPLASTSGKLPTKTNIRIHVGGLRYFCCPKGNIHSDSFCRAAADGISFAALFFQNHFSLILSQHGFSPTPQPVFDSVFDYNAGYLLFNASHVGIKQTLLRLVFCLLQKNKPFAHFLAPSPSLSQKVTLGSPVRLQTSSRRFDVAAFTSDQGSIPCDGHAKMSSFLCLSLCAGCRNKKIAIHVGGLRSFCCPKEISISAVSAAPNCLRVCCSALRYTPCAYK